MFHLHNSILAARAYNAACRGQELFAGLSLTFAIIGKYNAGKARLTAACAKYDSAPL